MAGQKTHSSGSGTPNQGGKSGNASGSNLKEARGPAYEAETRGKHPKNKIFKGSKDR